MKTNKILSWIDWLTFGYGIKKVSGVAQGDLRVNGAGSVIDSKVTNDFFVNGAAVIKNVSVGETMRVNGSLSAHSCASRRLEVNGSAHLSKCRIQVIASINGYLELDQTQVKMVSIEGKFKASSSQLESVLIKNSGSKTKPTITLIDSVVTGDVVFEKGEGIVLLQGSSEIVGNVANGKTWREG